MCDYRKNSCMSHHVTSFDRSDNLMLSEVSYPTYPIKTRHNLGPYFAVDPTNI